MKTTSKIYRRRLTRLERQLLLGIDHAIGFTAGVMGRFGMECRHCGIVATILENGDARISHSDRCLYLLYKELKKRGLIGNGNPKEN